MSRERVNPEQLECLISFMEEHPDLARGKPSIYSRMNVGKLWRLAAERLNSVEGGAVKSPDKWCRYWADIKYKCRKKNIAQNSELSHLEERLRRLAGTTPLRKHVRTKQEYSDSDEHGDPVKKLNFEEVDLDENSGIRAEELLTEAGLRTALASEKQAEATQQLVSVAQQIANTLSEMLLHMKQQSFSHLPS